MIEIPRNPRKRDLVVFGALLGPFVAFVGFLLLRHVTSPVPACIVWGAGAVLWLVFLLAPGSRRRIYVGWILAVFPIGWTVSHLIVLVIYYLVVTPLGLALRITGRDAMNRRFPPGGESYWSAKEPAGKKERYFRQF